MMEDREISVYYWNEGTETLHIRRSEDVASCLTCGCSDWIEEYPFLDGEEPGNPLLAARQQYQKERNAYYAQRAQQRTTDSTNHA
jgi:hypothetical protein